MPHEVFAILRGHHNIRIRFFCVVFLDRNEEIALGVAPTPHHLILIILFPRLFPRQPLGLMHQRQEQREVRLQPRSGPSSPYQKFCPQCWH